MHKQRGQRSEREERVKWAGERTESRWGMRWVSVWSWSQRRIACELVKHRCRWNIGAMRCEDWTGNWIINNQRKQARERESERANDGKRVRWGKQRKRKLPMQALKWLVRCDKIRQFANQTFCCALSFRTCTLYVVFSVADQIRADFELDFGCNRTR